MTISSDTVVPAGADHHPVTFAELLDRLVYSGLSEQEQGRRFERLAKRFLEVEPKYADQFSDVWLWNEWPGRNGKADTGVDIVAKDRYTGELTGIQAKFYPPEKKLQKGQIDSFFTQLGKVDFAQGMVVNTSIEWSKHAEGALQDQSKPVTTLGINELTDSTVDWSRFSFENPEELIQSPKKEPRKYQREAIDDVIEGFQTNDRGRLIMACGTGKTFTSLKLVEQMVPLGGSVLFLVPSIALLQQTLNEWTAQAETRLRAFAVCSDASVGKSVSEDISAVEIGFPATTDPMKLANRSKISSGQDAITVVFSTYQSIDVISQAQQLGLADFDLVISDEAHRTTGITEPGQDGSAFTAVHDPAKFKATKRLYMTATPRLYVQEAKAKAAQDDVTVYSMDDEATYGPEFHRLGFGKAVEMGHLTDYKVLVLAVNEDAVSSSFQSLFAEDSGLKLDDAARIVGCWNGLSKRSINGQKLDIQDTRPMRRAVAFARNIKESKRLAEQFESIGRQLLANQSDREKPGLMMEADHVDGTHSMLERTKKLDWLKEPTDGNTVRILSNAKCLSEGVDVPTLDSVLFLNPRNSQVDVVQSVGRVMRKAEGKEYGYIILPIAVPADQDPETALNDNARYKVVWDVLQALRAHDDRFEAMVNKIDLGGTTDRLDVITVNDPFNADDGGAPTEGDDASQRGSAEALFHLANAADWKDAIYARMVRKVGDRRYWEDWAADVKDIADRHISRIRGILDGEDPRPREEFAGFLTGLQGNLNESITEAGAIEMLSQHLITKPIFDSLFQDYDFTAHNPVSQVMESMVEVLESYHLDSEVDTLEDFYRGVRIRAEGITSAEGKQKIITELYERFFKLAFPRTAESLGIVYTPLEVVDFIIRAVDDVLLKDFGVGITDEGVHVLDPFTGTGTFIVRLLQSGRIRREDLLRKYTQELHANEILLMAYYIAALNIEATFHGLQLEQQNPNTPARDAGPVASPDGAAGAEVVGSADGVGYVPFDGIVLTDTFQMTEDGDTLDDHVFTSNNERVVAQNQLDIRVIIGNPPYSVGQTSGNDNNANLKYTTLDESIRSTYDARSQASLKKSLYDSYIRAIRWASNRILTSEQGGVVCYVSNGGYIDSNSADGLRLSLADEFHDIYVYNLRGNQRTAGEQSRKEGGKVFDAGSRATVAILLLVKRPGPVEQGRLHYKDIGDYLSRDEKLQLVDEATFTTLDWQTITPNAEGDWINQRDASYEQYPWIADKRATKAIFAVQSGGLKTNRDAWVYNASRERLTSNVRHFVSTYEKELIDHGRSVNSVQELRNTVSLDATMIKWDGNLEYRFLKGVAIDWIPESLRVGTYRAFNKQNVYFNRALNNSVYRLNELFPDTDHGNVGFYNVGSGSAVPFSVLMTDAQPDLHVTGAGSGGQFFARYSYVEAPAQRTGTQGDLFVGEEGPASGFKRVDNITDWAQGEYRAAYGPQVSKDEIFFYVYGLLHSPEYRKRYAADLKKSLPRIPQVPGRDRFEAFFDAGRRLSELHIGYEEVEPYPLTEVVSPVAPEDEYERFAVQKMKYGGKPGAWDKSRIRYNAYVDLEGIPEEAHRYLLGSRSGLDWILERYQVKTDKASGIVNDPNDWSREHEQPRYIVDLIARIVTVSLETMRIVDDLPDLSL
ncbi:type ISP restriction/modification enzyme [Citricoccus sp. NPDC079358]|uniref:DEAD/DEAH box helicase n=1 Tax=Citricoccus sp. NPDC079358 TaxID=3154653 RepID=UPI00344D7846